MKLDGREDGMNSNRIINEGMVARLSLGRKSSSYCFNKMVIETILLSGGLMSIYLRIKLL